MPYSLTDKEIFCSRLLSIFHDFIVINQLLFLKSGLSLDRLKSFLLVAEAESFTKAAGGNSNRQTQFSRQIKELEEFFGTALFERKGRTVSLSSSGKELHTLVAEYFSALEDFQERCSGELGSYTIGAGESIIQWRLIPRLKDIKDSFEKADITFKNLRTRSIIDGINKGSIDFGIVRKSALTSGLESVNIGSLDLALFLPRKAHPKGGDEATLLSTLPLATMEGEGSYQSFLDELPAIHGIIIRKSISCSSFPMMAKTLKVLRIAAILPKIAKEELTSAEFEMREMDSLQTLRRKLCICWNKRRAKMNPTLQELGSSLSKLIKD